MQTMPSSEAFLFILAQHSLVEQEKAKVPRKRVPSFFAFFPRFPQCHNLVERRLLVSVCLPAKVEQQSFET